MKREWIRLLVLFLLLASCSSHLPAERPDDFSIYYSVSGGMMPYGANVSVSGDSAHSSFFAYGVTFDAAFQLSIIELDALYKVISDNQFDRIQTYEEEVYDRGGISITVTANGETYNKADGGMSFIKNGWQAEYSNVVEAINDLTNRAASDSTDFVIEWDESLAALYPTIHFDMGAEFLNLSAPGAMSGDMVHQAVLRTSNPGQAIRMQVIS